MLSKVGLYVRSAYAQRGMNWLGLPLVPKRLIRGAPHNRAAFNEFVLWIQSLGLQDLRQVVDVGANHGDFSQAAAALYPNAKVLLIEPLPHLRAPLERLCGSQAGRWQLADCALGSSPTKATLHIDPQDDAIGSLLGFSEQYRTANPQATANDSIQCQVSTLDDLCQSQGVQGIDLLKIDVEGFEFEVLKGAARMLPKTEAIVVELSLVRRAPGAEDGLLAMLSVLKAYSFAIVDVIPSLFAKSQTWKPVEFNILARRSP